MKSIMGNFSTELEEGEIKRRKGATTTTGGPPPMLLFICNKCNNMSEAAKLVISRAGGFER